MNFAFDNRKEGKWNKTEYQEYLATMAIAEKIADNVESKIIFKEDNPNSASNTADLCPYLCQTIINQTFLSMCLCIS